MEPPLDHLERIPAELKCTVTRYIDNLDDRKALVLVNKAWAEVVAPFLWETLTTDLIQSGQRHVLGLAHPTSNIVKHVRNIKLLSRSLTGNVDHLPMLLAAIPRGQLRGFSSASQIQLSTSNLLLLLHPKLEVFTTPESGVIAHAIQSPWTVGCLSYLKTLSVDVDLFTSKHLQKIWKECPKLVNLGFFQANNSPFRSLNVISVIEEDAFLPVDPGTLIPSIKEDSNLQVQAFEPLKLENLQLGNITLPKRLNTMFQRFDVLALSSLVLDTFAGAKGLLETLAAEFAGGHPGLRKLQITGLPDQVSDEFNTSLLGFLSSFCGLQQLKVQCTSCNKIHVDGIINHGNTLEELCIVNGGIHRQNEDQCFDAADLHKIATTCLKLEQLCLNLYEIDGDRNESDVLGPQPGVAFQPNEFEQALCAIATMPKLRILRLTNPPNYRKAYHRPGEVTRFFPRALQSGTERQGFQARADGVMRYLGEHGSSLKVLAFSPVEVLKKFDRPDKHGHIWPNYFYYRGRMTDDKGTDIAVARPLVNWSKEFPNATILGSLA
jgi:hypothetical protein